MERPSPSMFDNHSNDRWGRVVALSCAIIFAAPCLACLTGCRIFHRNQNVEPLVNARQLSLRGAEALHRKNFEDAETLFAEALDSSPVDERAQAGYSETLWNRGDHAGAIQHMNEAVRLSGGNPQYVVRLGHMYLDLGDLQRANKQAEFALEQDDRLASAWALYADILFEQNLWQESLENYHRALLIRSDYPEVQLQVAKLYRIVGRSQRALATVERMIDLHPTELTDPELLLVRGLALFDLDQADQAAACLAQASERLPIELKDDHIQLASAQHKLGQIVQSRMTLGRVLSEFPEDANARLLQARIDESFDRIAESPLDNGGLVR